MVRTETEGARSSVGRAAFRQAGDLTRHVRTVHEKRRDHACPHCIAVFGHASSLTTHVRTVHEKRRVQAGGQGGGHPVVSVVNVRSPASYSWQFESGSALN